MQPLNPAFDIGRTKYYADFFIIPLVAAALVLGEASQGWHGFLAWLYLVPLGGLAWSLTEYLTHRFLFHEPGKFARDHHVHHVKPAAFIGVSSAITAVAVAVLYGVLQVFLGFTAAGGVMVGVLAWYFVYIYSHDVFHHRRPGPGQFWYGQMRRHDVHHADIDGNYGVSSPLWDLVFRSYVPAPVRGRA